MQRSAFFDVVRPLFGRLSKDQVEGCEVILDEAHRRGWDDRWTAYALATTFHETAKTMQPIREYGRGRGRKYGKRVHGQVYYGRGYVQLTWHTNYKKMGKLLGVDLVGNPELALDPIIAARIMFEGMERGSFTGKKLGDYFNEHGADWRSARRIINGLDKADTIARYARTFYRAIGEMRKVGPGYIPPPPDIEPVPPRAPQAGRKTKPKGGLIAALFVALAATWTVFWDKIMEWINVLFL